MVYGQYDALAEGVNKAVVADRVVPKPRGLSFGMRAAVIGVMAFAGEPAGRRRMAGRVRLAGPEPGAPFVFGAGMAEVTWLARWLQPLRPQPG